MPPTEQQPSNAPPVSGEAPVTHSMVVSEVAATRSKIRIVWRAFAVLCIALLSVGVWFFLERQATKTSLQNLRLDQSKLLTVVAGSDLERQVKEVMTQLEALQSSETGAQGLQGEDGLQGAQGLVGPRGPVGVQGPQGNTGAQGLRGEPGSSGSVSCPNGACLSLQAEDASSVAESGSLNISGTVRAGSLRITNAAMLESTLAVADTTSLGGTLAVGGSAVFSSTVLVEGAITASAFRLNCPAGYIAVPGNSKFGTGDFCVMKYQAKNNSGNPVSSPSGIPWTNFNQQTAQDISRLTGGHLMTEAEWMTIAANVLWQPANWCDASGANCGFTPGTPGKYLASGHNDGTPNQALTAGLDTQPCFGTVAAGIDVACGSQAGTQKRTLTLSNGEVIWDIAGNVYEWTDAWIIGMEQPTIIDSFADDSEPFMWKEWTDINKRWSNLQYASPTSRGFTSAQGIGQLHSIDDSPGAGFNSLYYGYRRGGGFAQAQRAGAFALDLSRTANSTDTMTGFRVVR